MAGKQTHRSMRLNKEFKNRPTPVCPTGFWQKYKSRNGARETGHPQAKQNVLWSRPHT